MAPDSAEGLRGEIAGLRAMLESMKNSGYEMALPAKKQAVLTFLRERAIREEFALRLCDKTTDLAELPLLISSDIRIKRDQASRKAVMVIGPTGVGKTTTIAKLAAQAVKAGRKAAIINLDTWRIGAVEQTRIYARILGIPLASAANAADFSLHLGRFAESRDVVFIDTTGRNPRDEAYISDMAGLCRTTVPMELHLLMSAAADDQCMIEAHRAYQKLPIDYLGFTKIDEAARFGALYNLLCTYQKPVAWLTTGQRVPGDIEPATVKRLAGLIMNREQVAVSGS
jgi:flagellar biosynthesis protein FlhF